MNAFTGYIDPFRGPMVPNPWYNKPGFYQSWFYGGSPQLSAAYVAEMLRGISGSGPTGGKKPTTF
jgi:hypothetical protein